MKKILTYAKNRKGITIVMIALILVVLIMFLGLAVDFAYMYFVKNQTQVAADAGALAGAGLLAELGNLAQQPPRNEAVKFCAKNTAGRDPMTIANDPNSNTLSDTNDITLGYFNYSTRQYTPNILPVNSIEVRARRTGNSPSGPITSVLLGKAFGWQGLSAASKAIAGRPLTTGAPMSLCVDACSLDPGEGNPPVPFYFKESGGPWEPPVAQTIAWTELSPTERDTELRRDGIVGKMLRGEIPMPNVCCQKIMTNNGIGVVTLQELPEKFALEAAKTGGYWDVLVPIVGQTPSTCTGQTEIKGCPPGAQPTEPYLVSRYARIRIIQILGNPRPGFLVSKIDCRNCPADDFFGNRAALLK